VLFYRVKRIGEQSPDNFGYLFAVGVTAMLFVQIAINLGMNLGLLPVTGIPAPFLSYGGSSLLSLFLAFGMLESIYRSRRPSLGTAFTLEQSSL
jgi:rod shape determining protein RodA